MSLDNAAVVPVIEVTDIPSAAPDFDGMSDRELLLYVAKNMHAVLTLANSVHSEFAPTLERLKRNPLLGSMFR